MCKKDKCAHPPTACTTPLPAKSITPLLSSVNLKIGRAFPKASGRAPHAESQPCPHTQCTANRTFKRRGGKKRVCLKRTLAAQEGLHKEEVFPLRIFVSQKYLLSENTSRRGSRVCVIPSASGRVDMQGSRSSPYIQCRAERLRWHGVRKGCAGLCVMADGVSVLACVRVCVRERWIARVGESNGGREMNGKSNGGRE